MRTWLIVLALVAGCFCLGCGQKSAQTLVGDAADETWDEDTEEAEPEEAESGDVESPDADEQADETETADEVETTVETGTQGTAAAAEEWKKQPGLYAVFNTSKGKIVCRLFKDKAPKTVKNFVSLAKGAKEWKDPKTGKMVKRPFYDGLIFHRVIPDFMIQGGCPLGTGTGDPGYKFEDEFDASLRFSTKGKLAMANSGPNTNGSQFFITVAPTTHLNDKHTIFGEVVEGQDLADAISKVTTAAGNRPKTDIVMKSVKIEHVNAKIAAS